MTGPIIVINEWNGPPPGVPTAIPQLVFANIDAPSTTPDLIADTIAPGLNSFEKWLQLMVVSPADTSLSNVRLVFSQATPTDASGRPSLSVLYGVGAQYPEFGPTDAPSTVAVKQTTPQRPSAQITPPLPNVVVPLALDNVEGATSVFVTLQLQASIGTQPGAFNFPSNFCVVQYDWA